MHLIVYLLKKLVLVPRSPYKMLGFLRKAFLHHGIHAVFGVFFLLLFDLLVFRFRGFANVMIKI